MSEETYNIIVTYKEPALNGVFLKECFYDISKKDIDKIKLWNTTRNEFDSFIIGYDVFGEKHAIVRRKIIRIHDALYENIIFEEKFS